MKNLSILYLLLVIGISASKAQTRDNPWALGIHTGISEYNGEMGNGFFKFDLTSHAIWNKLGDNVWTDHYNNPGMLGFSLSKFQSSMFDFDLRVFHGEAGYFKDSVTFFYRVMNYGDISARWKFLNSETARFIPYLSLGFGLRNVPTVSEAVDESIMDLIIPVGLGVKIRATNRISVNVNTYFGLNFGDKVDATTTTSANDMLWHHTIGVAFNFGRSSRDSDGDGVSDANDKCPNTVAGAKVDKSGCIYDRDKDGVADDVDACPDVPGLTRFKGCPDTDGDGIQDSEDKCPTVAGIIQFNGCPDTDGDGIQDSEDKCPNIVGLVKFKGCPDSDGDDIEDSKDKCPTVAGLAKFEGCPDTDGDGIPDHLDKCPKIAGVSSNNGCPEIKAEEKKIMAEALAGVMFETGSAKIRTVSYPKLLNVVKVMKNNPDYKLRIEGHTDNVGDPQKNLELSKERAASVKQYLITNGINASRLTSEGFGETKPIADNNTSAGKLKNRRVEFTLEF